MQVPLDFPPALKKKGLEPNEFKILLVSKMTKLLFDCEEQNLQTGRLERSIEIATQCCVIRENITNPGMVDGRRRSTEQMRNEGIQNLPSSPSNVQRQPRSRGSTNPIGQVHGGYHKKQHELFLKLQKQDNLESSFDGQGYFILQENGVRCTIEGMCNILDGITRRAYIAGDLPGSTTRDSLREICGLLKSIVLGRIYVDWAVENDIMSEGGHKRWKEHVWALMSFAAFLVITDVLSKFPKYGSKSLIKEEM